jgi:cephalosporin hydroxylase
MNRFERFKFILGQFGLFETFRFILVRVIGQSDLLRPASTVDIRRAGVRFVEDVSDFVNRLIEEFDVQVTPELMAEAIKVNEAIENRAAKTNYKFPVNWNSEGQLRVALYLLVRILKPTLIVETGTANGSSAAAICSALSENNSGKLVSVDVKESEAVLVDVESRKFLDLRRTSGQEKELEKICFDESSRSEGIKIFLHDSDHSFFGQFSDFKIAKKFKFDIILSDDIDASMAFLNFAQQSSIALFDTRKIIGGFTNSSKRLLK